MKKTLQAQETCFQYGPLASSLKDHTAFFWMEDAKGEIVEQRINKQKFSLSQFMNEMVGKTITLTTQYNEEITGKLLAQNNESLTLFLDESQKMLMVKRDDISLIDAEGLAEAISLKPSLEAKYITDETHESVHGQVIFLASELMWKPSYRLILDESDEGNITGKWISEAHITNHSKQAFENLVVKVVAGQLKEEHGPSPMPRAEYCQMKMACDNQMVAGGVAIEQEWDDLKAYMLPYKVSIKPQEMLATKLYDSKVTAVNKKYLLNYSSYQQGKTHPRVSYEIANSSDDELNLALPKGKVQVYQNKNQQLDYLGSASIQDTPKGQPIRVETAECFDLMAKRNVESKPVKNITGKVVAHEFTVTLELTNGSDEAKTISIKENLSNHVKLLNSSLPQLEELMGENAFDVVVPANTSSEEPLVVSYTYTKRVS